MRIKSGKITTVVMTFTSGSWAHACEWDRRRTGAPSVRSTTETSESNLDPFPSGFTLRESSRILPNSNPSSNCRTTSSPSFVKSSTSSLRTGCWILVVVGVPWPLMLERTTAVTLPEVSTTNLNQKAIALIIRTIVSDSRSKADCLWKRPTSEERCSAFSRTNPLQRLP